MQTLALSKCFAQRPEERLDGLFKSRDEARPEGMVRKRVDGPLIAALGMRNRSLGDFVGQSNGQQPD